MNFPIIYKIGEDGEGNPIFLDDEVKDIIYVALREMWNHRPDYDPPTWGELFSYTQINYGYLSNIVCGATMEQVICNILGKPICQTSIDEITPMTIEPNMEDIVKEYFEQLVCDDSYYLYSLNRLEELEEELEEEDRARERETKPGAVLKIIEGILQTDDQTLDEGSYLELCKLLKEIHVDYKKIEKHDQVVKELEDEKEMRIYAEKRANDNVTNSANELHRLRRCVKYETERAKKAEERVSAAEIGQFIAGQKLKEADEYLKLVVEIHLSAAEKRAQVAEERAQVAEEKLRAVCWLTEEEIIAG
jgi:hypothetical protein